MQEQHFTEKIAIKTENIDSHIVTFVNWLNSKESTFTIYSCQGDPKINDNECSFLPYVSFYCDSDQDLKAIKKLVSDISLELRGDEYINFDISIRYSEYNIMTIYQIHMSGRTVLEKITKRITNAI